MKNNDIVSFILFTEWKESVLSLTDNKAGKLLKAIFVYVTSGVTDPESSIYPLFLSLKPAIDRNTEKYLKQVEANRKNGLLGGRPKLNKPDHNPINPVGYFGNPNNLDSGSDSGSDNKHNKTLTTGNSYKDKKYSSHLKDVPVSLTPELKDKLWRELEVASAKEVSKQNGR